MTIEMLGAVRDYVGKLRRQRELRTVGSLLRAADGGARNQGNVALVF